MPILGSIYLGSSSWSAEDIVYDNIERNNNHLPVEKAGYKEFEKLTDINRVLEDDNGQYLTRTNSPETIPRAKRIIASINASLLLKLANMISSSKNGADKAIAKGHPSIPPIEK